MTDEQRKAFEAGARWMRSRAAKVAVKVGDPIEGEKIAAAIRSLPVVKQGLP